MKHSFKRLARLLLVCAAVHELLLWWLGHSDLLALLFAPGPHLPLPQLTLAVVFLALRLALYLVVPPLVVSWAAAALFAWSQVHLPAPGPKRPKSRTPTTGPSSAA